MSVFGILANGRGTGPSFEEQQKHLALKKMAALSDEIKTLELTLFNKRMQLESATAHAKAIGAVKPQSRRASLISLPDQGAAAVQGDGRRGSRSAQRSRDYQIKEICFQGSYCSITIEQGPCITKIGLSHFNNDEDKQIVAKLADEIKFKGKNWGAIGVSLSKFNRNHAVQSCGNDVYALVSRA